MSASNESRRHRLTIISGGQTGADRAALDAALQSGVPCGGSCPLGRLAEDGAIPARYPLTELASARYHERTMQNVAASDGTVVFAYGQPKRGSAFTVKCCDRHLRPCLVIDCTQDTAEAAGKTLAEFVLQKNIEILNVAGSRLSQSAGIHNYVFTAVTTAIVIIRG